MSSHYHLFFSIFPLSSSLQKTSPFFLSSTISPNPHSPLISCNPNLYINIRDVAERSSQKQESQHNTLALSALPLFLATLSRWLRGLQDPSKIPKAIGQALQEIVPRTSQKSKERLPYLHILWRTLTQHRQDTGSHNHCGRYPWTILRFHQDRRWWYRRTTLVHQVPLPWWLCGQRMLFYRGVGAYPCIED